MQKQGAYISRKDDEEMRVIYVWAHFQGRNHERSIYRSKKGKLGQSSSFWSLNDCHFKLPPWEPTTFILRGYNSDL